jgi:hypothetical protein
MISPGRKARVAVFHSLQVKVCKVPLIRVAPERPSQARGVRLNAQARLDFVVFAFPVLLVLRDSSVSFDVATGRPFEKCAPFRNLKCRQR